MKIPQPKFSGRTHPSSASPSEAFAASNSSHLRLLPLPIAPMKEALSKKKGP